MNLINNIMIAVVVFIIIATGTGMMLGGAGKARKNTTWEL